MEKGRIKLPKIPYSKRKDGRYYKQIIIGVDENGKRKVKTLYDRDWRELDKKVREFQVGMSHGRFVSKDITLGECVDMWIKGKNDVCVGTKKNYCAMQNMLQPIAHIKIDKIKPAQIEYLYADLHGRGVNASIKNLSGFLKRIYRFAIDNQFASVNVAEKARTPKITTGKRRALTENEREAVLKAFTVFNDFEKAFVGIAYYAGLRRNEILALTVDDIDFENRVILVNKTLVTDFHGIPIVQDHPKSKAGIRNIPICAQLGTILRKYIRFNVSDDDNRLFTTVHGNNISKKLYEYRWKNILDKINSFMPKGEHTEISAHYLRHNWATDLIYAGIPLKSVQYMMGHENIGMTLGIYADVRIDNGSIVKTMTDFWK